VDDGELRAGSEKKQSRKAEATDEEDPLEDRRGDTGTPGRGDIAILIPRITTGVDCLISQYSPLRVAVSPLSPRHAGHAANLTTFSAASFIPLATVKFNPDSRITR